MNVNIRPKNIIVVGGASGIGFATAQQLLDNGCDSVILASRNCKKLEFAKSTLKKNTNQKVLTVQFNIANVSSHDEMIENIHNELQTVPDGLVISSGVNFDGSNWKGFNLTEDEWDYVMNINLKGVFFLIRNYSNYLLGRTVKGNICVVSSISAHRDLISIYQITKNAISGIVHAYGKHLYERGIILNCIEPGTVYTDMMKHLAGYTDGVREGNPWADNTLHRLLRTDEMAKIICFLMSDLGEVLCGSCVLAGGGCKSI